MATAHGADDAHPGAEVARLRAALRRQEAQGRILAEIAGEYTYAFRRTEGGDDHGWVTAGFTRLTGFTEAEMTRRGWSTLAHPDDRPLLRDRQEAIAAGAPFEREYRILTKSGETRWVRDTLRVAEPDDAGDVWVYGAVRDATDAKRAEATAARLVAQVRTAEREAASSERRLREVFMQVPAAIAVYRGPEHVAEFVNPAYERLLGRTAAQAVGKTVRETFPEIPADAPVFRLLDRAYAEDTTVAMPAFLVRYDRDGDGALEDVYYDTTYHPLHDAEGRLRGVLVHAIEVTEQVRARQQAEASLAQVRAAQREAETEQERMRELFEHMPAAISLLTGPEHVYTFINPTGERFAGRTAATILGRRFRDAFPELGDAQTLAVLDRVYATGEPFVAEASRLFYDRDGDGEREEAYFTLAFQPVRSAEGRVTGILVHAVEVTEQVRGRDALRAERDRLQEVLDVLPEAVLIADVAPTFTVSNRAAAAILGLDPVGQPVPLAGDEAYEAFGASYLDGTPFPADQLPLERALRGETVRGEQLLLRHAITGESAPVLANAAPLHDTTGATAGAVVVFQDIADVLEGERTREAFISTTAHDLKGPLTSVRGYAQLAARRLGKLHGVDTAPIAAALGNIEAATERMLDLINEMADATRIRMGVPLELRRTPIDLVALVREVVAGQAFTGQRISVDAETPALVAEVDASRFERVLTNLIGNAIKYSPPNAPIGVRVGRETGGDGTVATVAVVDRGVGIPAEDLPTIWDRYTRGGNVSGRIAGSGLGLASVRAIVERHGGTVSVESIVGEGSTFTVRVPLRSSE